MKGPVMTSMTVYEDFMFYQSGVYKHVTGSRLGGHAIAIVGWNDTEQAWIVRNSWGPDWGEEGYFRIAYDDASGLGESAISFVVESISAMAHVTDPLNFRPVRGIANVNVHGLVPLDASGFKIEMKKVGPDFAPPTLVIDMPSNSAPHDFSQMSDGLYEIKSSILKAEGVVGKPGYSHIIVANQDKNFSVEAIPDFDATKPVKDRVYVKIQSNTLDIPLTHAELIISDVGGSVVKKVRVEDPGAQTMVSWRTQTFANGPYVIYAKGFVGHLQEFTSAPLSVTVGNDLP